MATKRTRPSTNTLDILKGLPVRRWDDGSIRVAETRVHFWLVTALLGTASTAEEVADSLPSVPLAAVLEIESFRRTHAVEVDEYCRAVDREAASLKRRILREQRARRAGQ